VGVWWFPGLVLQMTALVLSVAWGLTAGGASYVMWGRNSVATASAAAVGIVAFVFAMLALSFINSGEVVGGGRGEGCIYSSCCDGC
jgi:hypothetical protein